MKVKASRCVVTGASSGIGLEVVRLLLDKGATVLGVSKDMSSCPIKHDNFFSFSCDISTKENVDALFSHAIDLLGDIDLFYANAGFSYWGKETKADWNRIEDIFNVNVFSVFYSLQKLKELKGNRSFNFSITASGMSFATLPGYALYGATKGALKSFAEGYRYELNQNQVLTVIYPIATKTNFFSIANTTHIPSPVQEVEVVARKVLRGIEKDKKEVYPFFLFRVLLVFFNVFPITKRLYLNSQARFLK